jgi:AcrR family transcriptional regulator
MHCVAMTSRARMQPGASEPAADAASALPALPALPALLRPRREPAFHQDRARRSYLALIDAATALFGARGYDAIGTPEIAQRAGVSVGTFYRYFDDKREIYLEIARRTMTSGYRKTIAGLGAERFVGRARRETISETIAILFDHVLAYPDLTRSFREMSLRDPEMSALSQAVEQFSTARIASLIASIVGRDVVPDPEATAWVLHAAVMEVAYGLAGHRGTPPISSERAHRALTDFIERAVFVRG